jgi:hypothetical protein
MRRQCHESSLRREFTHRWALWMDYFFDNGESIRLRVYEQRFEWSLITNDTLT